MPYKIVKDEKKCSPSKPFACINSDTGKVHGCHPTRQAAIQQLRALYRNVPDAKGMSEMPTDEQLLSFLIPLQFAETTKWVDGNKLWLQIYPFDTWDHPMYGETTIDKNRASALKYNFDSGVRGHEVVVDYEHGLDPAKGHKAAGWYRQLDIRDNGLWGLVEFSDTAKAEIDAGEWKYFSGEHYDTWTHPQNGSTYDFVLSGGGLTNKPWVKGMLPLNFSEVMQFATKTPKKPYGDVTYADPGYQSDGKKRYPLDTEAHIRAAWSYINMPKNASKYSSSQVASIKSKIKAAMKRIGAAIKHAEMLDEAIEEELNANLMSEDEATRIVDESKEWEHSDPGTGNPPVPRLDEESGIDEPDRTGGWRRATPPDQDAPPGPQNPSSEGGNTLSDGLFSDKDVNELRRVLDLPVDAHGDKIVETIKVKFGELHSLREAVSAADQEKVFAEQYPQYWGEHRKLMERDREHTAKSFSESVSKVRDQQGYGLVETKRGLSTVAVEKVTTTHKKFSEGTVTLEDFEECIKSIVNGGIVQFGEIGNSTDDSLPDIDTSSAPGIAGARKLFAEVVSKVQREHPDWDYLKCVDEAGNKHPDLAGAYRVTLPA